MSYEWLTPTKYLPRDQDHKPPPFHLPSEIKTYQVPKVERAWETETLR